MGGVIEYLIFLLVGGGRGGGESCLRLPVTNKTDFCSIFLLLFRSHLPLVVKFANSRQLHHKSGL